MNMVTRFIGLVGIVGSVALSSCSEPPLAVPLAQACEESHDGKTITTEGYVSLGRGLFCSGDRNGDLRCGVYMLAAPGEVDFEKKNLSVDIVQGTSANQIAPVERGFRAEDLVIRDAQGSQIELSQPIQVTGRMLTSERVCNMEVDEINVVSSR